MDGNVESTLAYLERVLGITLCHAPRGTWKGLCPFHDERTPSFMVWPDGHSYCFGCHWSGWNVYSLIMKHEGVDIKRAVQRAKDLSFAEPTVPTARVTRSPLPTDEQKLCLGIAMDYYQRCLNERKGKPGRDYLYETRGLAGPYASALQGAIGYAPAGHMVGRSELVPSLRAAFSNRWVEVAKSTGLLTERGTERLSSRIIFIIRNAEGEAVYYQARSILPDIDKRWKFLNPPGLRKQPYTPNRYPYKPGTFIVEGGQDTLAVAAQGYYTIGLLGSALPSLNEIKKWPQPLCGLLDTDTNAYQTGQTTQAKLAKMAEQAHLDYHDYHLAGVKDPAEALEQWGPDRLDWELAHQQSPILAAA